MAFAFGSTPSDGVGGIVAEEELTALIAAYLHSRYPAHVRETVTITSRGVIILPAKLRRVLGLKANDQLIAESTPEGLLLRPAVTLPVELYTDERVREFDEAEEELAEALDLPKPPQG